LQILRIKPFCEPIIDFFKETPRLGIFALGPPQPRQAHGDAQFEGFRPLPVGNL
jgi:hypothetical protein